MVRSREWWGQGVEVGWVESPGWWGSRVVGSRGFWGLRVGESRGWWGSRSSGGQGCDGGLGVVGSRGGVKRGKGVVGVYI